MKTLSLTRDTIVSLSQLMLTYPATEVKEVRMCVKAADVLEAVDKVNEEKEMDSEVEFEMEDEVFTFIKNGLIAHGLSGKAGVRWNNKRNYIVLVDYLEEIAK